MKYKITKHAKGMFEVRISTFAWKQAESDWLPFSNLYVYPEFKDLRSAISIVRSPVDDYDCYTFKTDLETFEIIVDIFSYFKHYDLTQMKQILSEIKGDT